MDLHKYYKKATPQSSKYNVIYTFSFIKNELEY